MPPTRTPCTRGGYIAKVATIRARRTREALFERKSRGRSKSDRECAQREAPGHIEIDFTKDARMGPRRARALYSKYFIYEITYVSPMLVESLLFKFTPSMYPPTPCWPDLRKNSAFAPHFRFGYIPTRKRRRISLLCGDQTCRRDLSTSGSGRIARRVGGC
jgi:hypothetical protein